MSSKKTFEIKKNDPLNLQYNGRSGMYFQKLTMAFASRRSVAKHYPETLEACWTAQFRIESVDKCELNVYQCVHGIQNCPIVDVDFSTKAHLADEHAICQFYTRSLPFDAWRGRRVWARGAGGLCAGGAGQTLRARSTFRRIQGRKQRSP